MTEIPHTDVWREIRVPAKVLKYWSEPDVFGGQIAPLLFCGLDDGSVYQSVKIPCSKGPQDGLPNYTRRWELHTPAMEGR